MSLFPNLGSYTDLQSRFDRRVNKQFETIENQIIKNDTISASVPNLTGLELEIQKVNDLITMTKNSIQFKYQMYKRVSASSGSGKALKKQISEEIDLLKKMLVKQSIFAEKIVIKNQIKNLENSFKWCKILSIFIKYFSSIVSMDKLKRFSAEKLSDNIQLPSFFDLHEQLASSSTREEINVMIGEEINEIENQIIEKQSRDLGKEIWKPKEITKQSLIDRITFVCNDALTREYNEDYSNYISGIVESIDNDIDGNVVKGLNKINDNIDLIITSKNNYYLVLKTDKIGMGATKTAYRAFDLSKNELVAILYADQKVKIDVPKIRKEEEKYLDIKNYFNSKGETNGLTKIKDFLMNEEQKICIFVSDYYGKGDLSKNLDKISDKLEFSEKLIKAVDLTVQSGYFLPDFKPENVLIDRLGDPRLTDFENDVHTDAFLAPDRLPSKGLKPHPADEKSAVWALGMSLYRVFYGKSFFGEPLGLTSSESYQMNEILNAYADEKLKARAKILYTIKRLLTDERIESVLKNTAEENPKVNPFVSEMIQSMLKRNPFDRPSPSEIRAWWAAARKMLEMDPRAIPSLPQIKKQCKAAKKQAIL